MRRERVPEAAVDRTAHTIENLKQVRQLMPAQVLRRMIFLEAVLNLSANLHHLLKE
jgi:hypothetical protein